MCDVCDGGQGVERHVLCAGQPGAAAWPDAAHPPRRNGATIPRHRHATIGCMSQQRAGASMHALAAWHMPVLHTCYLLYYTDGASLFALLATWSLALEQRHGWAALVGVVSMTFRQVRACGCGALLSTADQCGVGDVCGRGGSVAAAGCDAGRRVVRCRAAFHAVHSPCPEWRRFTSLLTLPLRHGRPLLRISLPYAGASHPSCIHSPLTRQQRRRGSLWPSWCGTAALWLADLHCMRPSVTACSWGTGAAMRRCCTCRSCCTLPRSRHCC